ncbi:hypothetical protein [Legionella spiritensis]|uniref:Uncharacterized protein n=1 Tax=Legionella spiritensis TaxID=452 RepID=A0A0W0Z519_LEGSP|nr:hypothetical protein [Legionella spiritensis]KTD64256.1 hypothetical protein Lspi_1063 [Legionella spiritensis]SNV47099.1 Uncharacterised protein [Legionella spiritensis]
MKCSACGYVRKGTDLAPAWQCPSCKIAYIKSECGLLWMSIHPTEKDIPKNMNAAYIIFNGNKLYHFNKINKFPLSDGVTLNEDNRKAVVLILAQLKSSIKVSEEQKILSKNLTQEQINIFKAIMSSKNEHSSNGSSKWYRWLLSLSRCYKKNRSENPEINDKTATEILENNFLNRHLKLILLFLNIFLVVVWMFYLTNSYYNPEINNKIQNESSKNINTKAANHAATINLSGIDLNKISNYAEASATLASDCKINVQVYHKYDENCKKSLKLLREIEPEFKKHLKCNKK